MLDRRSSRPFVRRLLHVVLMTALLPLAWSAVPPVAQAAQPGMDGPLTVTAANTIVNQYAQLAADAAPGATSFSVTNIADLTSQTLGPLTAGDLLMLIQMQGAVIDTTDATSYGAISGYNNAGRYEFVTVGGVSGNTINLDTSATSICAGGLRYSYTSSAKVQVVRVPQYSTLTINAGASIVPAAWDGQKGGVVAIHAQSTVTLNGSIDASGRGFRGGTVHQSAVTYGQTSYRSTSANLGGEKGEGIAGSQVAYDSLNGRYGRGAPANGGGGGDNHNTGGGGGANGSNGNTWTGQGIKDPTYNTAWSLDPNNTNMNSSGGGRGGYSFSNNDQNATNRAPGATQWGGDNRREVGGLGGRPLANDPTGRLFLGGGGGAGDNNDNTGGSGGNGGGLIYVIANTVAGTGTILANGANGGDSGTLDAAGGAGGGGSVVVKATTLSSITIQANGGTGGTQTGSGTAEAEGPGGGGGGGYIATSGGTVTQSANGGVNGTTTSTQLSEFPPNGATRGAAGQTGQAAPTDVTIPFCFNSSLGIAKQAGSVVANGDGSYTVPFTFTIKNLGDTILNNVQVTDNLANAFPSPATFTLIGTPSGTGVTANSKYDGNATPDLLAAGQTLAVGAIATVTLVIKVTPNSSAGPFSNTATGTATSSSGQTVTDISENGANPDPNGNGNANEAGENDPTPVVLSSAGAACATAGKDGPNTAVTGVINTYYPGTATASAGAATISVGAATGASTPIAAGDLLLVIQMQDAAINSNNSGGYGGGNSAGRGATDLNNTGRYEYVVATSAVTSGSVSIRGVGANNGLLYTYTAAAVSTAQGQRTFQVVRVPQYSSATLTNGLTAAAWNGVTGGILAFDVAGALNLGSSTVNVDGLGFRGGGGRQLNGGAGGTGTDYRSLSTNAFHAAKGEGIAGTPRYVFDGTALVDTLSAAQVAAGIDGYPNGSTARGAPGNAGGGGTDANPTANDQNTGGGGGSNAATGGQGGNSWSSNQPVGGVGGADFTVAAPNRVILGGGGGAGTTNNGTGLPNGLSSSGAAGGGIVMIRAGSASGTGTISANGASASTAVLNDGSGGGGAGGSVILLTGSGSLSNLTVNANGGVGGSNTGTGSPHGPGGGGSGGFVGLSSAAAAINVTGGANGTTAGTDPAFGATAGKTGSKVTTTTRSDILGVQSGAPCVPALTVTKTTSTASVNNTPSGTTATYTINVANAANRSNATSVAISDALPSGFTYAATSAITLNGGATRTATTDPSVGATTPSWGSFTIPGGASVQITFTINIAAGVSGTFQNPATATYLDPARTTPTGTTSASYDPASSTGEDVTVTSGTVTGRAFSDTNANGLQDGGETGAANVTVQLLNSSGTVIATTTTNSSGAYSFGSVAPGAYSIQFAAPSGAKWSPQDVGSNDAIDSDVNNTGRSAQFTVAAGATSTVDAGLYYPAIVGDTVFVDTDRDGGQDVGEPGLANVSLTLKTPGPDGIVGNADDVTVATTSTDSSGKYVFTGIVPGNYYVDVTNGTIPAGLTVTTGTSDPTTAFTLTSGQAKLDLDLGYTNSSATTGIIGDSVWSDANGNGVRDPGERGISGVTLALKSAGPDGIFGTADDVTVTTATTVADGSYRFTGVAPGEYVVDVTDTANKLAGYTITSGPQSSTDPSAPLTVTAGGMYLNTDFGYRNTSLYSISDTVWYDANGNGVKDTGEGGIPNVTFKLIDAGGQVIATAISDANGAFSFAGIPNGAYTVAVDRFATNPAGYIGTTASATSGSRTITVSNGAVTNTSFGYNQPGSIGDTVFSDANGNGTQDAGEAGIAGVTVELWRDTNSDGVFDATVDQRVGSTTTDASGNYLFSGLGAGTYFASVGTQAALTGYSATTTDQQTGTNAAGVQLTVAIGSATASSHNADFGYRNVGLADVSGSIWNDVNTDAIKNASETGIAGVTIALLDGNGNVVATTTTDASGNYTFPDVGPGNYSVKITDTAGILQGYSPTSGYDPAPVTVSGTTSVTNVNFGYVRNPQTGSIGNYIWLDADRNGVQNAGENGIGNVRLVLKTAGPDGNVGNGDDVTIATTTSDSYGRYSFTNLAAGNYYVSVDQTTLPNGGAGLATTTGSSNPSRLIALSPSEQNGQADFGYASTTGSALGDRVWSDADGDGAQDSGELGIGGVKLTITGPAFPTGTTVTTNADGSWLLTGVTPGSYTVTVNTGTLPSGYTTTPTNGTASRTITIVSGQDALYADFGFRNTALGSIGTTMFFDTNGNGTKDAGENGLGSVTLNLIGAGADNTFGTVDDIILDSTTTDANGQYAFTGVPAGNYRVQVTDANGVLTGLNLTTGTNPTGTIVLAAGQNNTSTNFGYTASGGSVNGSIWHDLNGNGILAAGEPGLAGVTINLWRDTNNNGVIDQGDNLIRTATSDTTGSYEFAGVPPGTYLVDVTDTAGVLTSFTKSPTPTGGAGVDNNSQANPYSVTLTSGAPNNATADFGYKAATARTISGLVFKDMNRNATFDTGDARFPAVTLLLYRDLDGDGVLDPGEPQIATTTSSTVDGTYTFADLPDGKYIVAADASTSRLSGTYQTTQAATQAVQPVTISGSNVGNQNFGFYPSTAPTLVSGASFTATAQSDRIVLRWNTITEYQTSGFYLYRSSDGNRQNAVQITATLIPAQGSGAVGAAYAWTDTDVQPDTTYTYWLQEVETGDKRNEYGPATARIRAASTFQYRVLLPFVQP